uniref:Sushi domain-containing protein n=1 Tax=Chelonoidis abingdonii TaxID=106734 RepID=A0A8C0IU60_CHEAB
TLPPPTHSAALTRRGAEQRSARLLNCRALLGLGQCGAPPTLSRAVPRDTNGRESFPVMNNSYPVGTKLKYSCRPGYILGSGKSPFVTCLPNSTWSVDPEFCVGEYLCCFSISTDVQAILT